MTYRVQPGNLGYEAFYGHSEFWHK